MRSFLSGLLVAPALVAPGGVAAAVVPSVVPSAAAPSLVPPAAAGPRPAPAAGALVRAALVDLSRRTAFRMVRTAPSLEEVSLVEPRAGEEAATLSFSGPRGAGTLKVVVAGGNEDLEGDRAGWEDFLLQSGAPASAVALAPRLAGTWYSTPSEVSFGPSLSGIGHVFCSGSGCTLAGSRLLASGSPTVVSTPGFGGHLLVRPGARPLPLELQGTGSRARERLRFAYPARARTVVPPTATVPLPGVLGQ